MKVFLCQALLIFGHHINYYLRNQFSAVPVPPNPADNRKFSVLLLMEDVYLFLFLGPSLPIIEDLRPAEFGLNVSWKSDVNSRQDKFEVVIRRIDTGKCSTNFG